MTDAYQRAVHEKILARERERSALVGAVLDGRNQDTQDLWDTVEALRLSHDGPYVVIAAEIVEAGEQEQIRVVENRLSMAGVPSAWRLLPGGHTAVAGIAAIRGAARLETLSDVLSAAWPHRAGISPRFQVLSGARRALRFATLAMVGAPRGSAAVTVFDRAPIAVLAASAPDVMAEVAAAVLGSLNRLPDEDRGVLVGTLRTWLACGGSVDTASKALFCHPNTVRHRLNRVTEHTGRSLTDPQAVTELTLALQADYLTWAARASADDAQGQLRGAATLGQPGDLVPVEVVGVRRIFAATPTSRTRPRPRRARPARPEIFGNAAYSLCHSKLMRYHRTEHRDHWPPRRRGRQKLLPAARVT